MNVAETTRVIRLVSWLSRDSASTPLQSVNTAARTEDRRILKIRGCHCYIGPTGHLAVR